MSPRDLTSPTSSIAGAAPSSGRQDVSKTSDYEFASDVDEALHRGARLSTHLLLFAIIGLFAAAIAWASWASIEEVTRGDGRVIPSSQMQIVQSPDPGIVEEILIRQGDRVETGQVLVRIDDTSFSSTLGELTAPQISLRAQIARMRAEVAGDDAIAFGEDLLRDYADVAENERVLFTTRRDQLNSQLSNLRSQADQAEQSLAGLEAHENQLETSLSIARQELGIRLPLGNIVPQVEILRLRREVNDLEGQLAVTQSEILSAEAAVREAYGAIEESFLRFRSETLGTLNERLSQLAVIEETLRAAEDRVGRTDIRAPVDGIVNRVHVTTLGAVVQPGTDIVDIVPIEDSLLVEARLRPSDVAFVRTELPATVKITAYDFAVYGGLDGTVEWISADTIQDEETGESFYRIHIRTDQNHLGTDAEPLPIMPGMVASVDILTGEKTILEYLLNPINRARSEALRER